MEKYGDSRKNTVTIKDQKHEMKGHVFVLHETRGGKREFLDDDHNHIVLTGRRWLMQRALGMDFSEDVRQSSWTLRWFGL
jgi:hypothetical protein